MRMILVGPPGAGKGTQAVHIAATTGVPHISSGDMFRSAISRQTPLGIIADEHIRRGRLVPDEITIGMVLERLSQPDAAGGFLLDGFPRTAPQAEALDTALTAGGMSLDLVVLLEVPDEMITARVVGRRLDPITGAIYHLQNNPPPAEIVDRLVHRGDDHEEACASRLRQYHDETSAVIPYYEKRGILRRVDGVGDVDIVKARILWKP